MFKFALIHFNDYRHYTLHVYRPWSDLFNCNLSMWPWPWLFLFKVTLQFWLTFVFKFAFIHIIRARNLLFLPLANLCEWFQFELVNCFVQLAIRFPYFWTVFVIAVWYGYSFLGLELGSSFSPPLAEDLLAPAFFFPSFKELYYFLHHCHHMARQRVCVTRRFDFYIAFTVDLLKHLWDQDRYLVLHEISNSQLFSSAYIFNSQNWINFNSHFVSLQAWISSLDNWLQTLNFVCL